MEESDGGSRPASETHYQVLGLTPSLLETQHDPTILLKRAYHRALLRNHPDKAASAILNKSKAPQTAHPPIYTIDQISQAFKVLSSPRLRGEYDASLRVSRRAASATTAEPERFQTGVEVVDLDDLPYDEVDECWYRSCRCGNERGYLFSEADLVETGDEGELLVGCLDCSLWLMVHFAVLEDDEPTTTSSS